MSSMTDRFSCRGRLLQGYNPAGVISRRAAAPALNPCTLPCFNEFSKARTMTQAQVIITRRGVERVRGGHLWVYRSDVRDAERAEGGTVVRVRDERGRQVGQALYSSRSEIALRLLTTRGAA